MPKKTKTADAKSIPVHTISLESGVTAAIWPPIEGEYGPLHPVTVERRYKDGEEWKSSHSFIGAHNLIAAKAHELAYEYIAVNLKSNSR